MSDYRIYIDGAASNNQDTDKRMGGWGVFITENGAPIHTYSSPRENGTNSDFEVRALRSALMWVEGSLYNDTNFSPDIDVTIITDSSYVYRGVTEWMYNWNKNAWLNAKNQEVSQCEIWKDIYKRHFMIEDMRIKFELVKGHNGNFGNEIADKLARGVNVKL